MEDYFNEVKKELIRTISRFVIEKVHKHKDSKEIKAYLKQIRVEERPSYVLIEFIKKDETPDNIIYM